MESRDFVSITFEFDIDARVREYWEWLAVALYLFTALDMMTTYYAAALYGTRNEINPLMRWLLAENIWILAAINIAVIILVAVLFYGLVELLKHTPEPYNRIFAAGIEAWLGGLLAAGLLIFANNLTVIFFQQSLL